MIENSWFRFRVTLAGLACVTWLIPVHGQAAGPMASPNRPVVRDISLDAQARVMGQLVDPQGNPKANQTVVAQRYGGQPIQSKTDARGQFVLEGMTGGVYQIATTDTSIVCRCWTTETAPPAATRELLVVTGEGVQRGQHPIGDLLFSGPVLIALVIAAAIAIPIAIHNSDDAS